MSLLPHDRKRFFCILRTVLWMTVAFFAGRVLLP